MSPLPLGVMRHDGAIVAPPVQWTPIGQPWLAALWRADTGVTSRAGAAIQDGEDIGGIEDQSGDGQHLVASSDPSRNLIWLAADPRAGGRPAFGRPDEWDIHHLLSPSGLSAAAYYGVVGYGSGVESTFSNFPTLFASVEDSHRNKPRILGDRNTADIISAADEFADGAHVNGESVGATILPLPPSVVRFDANSGAYSQTWMIGGADYAIKRAWGGTQEIVALTNRLLTVEEDEQFVGWLAHEVGIEANLVAGHPYRDAPP